MKERGTKLTALLFTIVAVVFNQWWLGLPVIFLNVGLVIALITWWTNFEKIPYYTRRIIYLFVISIVIQTAHLLEEYYTGFYKELPLLFNSNSWPARQFVIFNIIWLIVFMAAAIGASQKSRFSYFIIWFFAIVVGIGNGLFHPLQSLWQGRYFPGTYTAFSLLIAGVLLIRNLCKE